VASNLQWVYALRWTGGDCKWCITSYRPQINIQTGHIMGAEALPRWQYPKLGRVSLAEFVPNAEDSGMILSIGGMGLRSALACKPSPKGRKRRNNGRS